MTVVDNGDESDKAWKLSYFIYDWKSVVIIHGPSIRCQCIKLKGQYF